MIDLNEEEKAFFQVKENRKIVLSLLEKYINHLDRLSSLKVVDEKTAVLNILARQQAIVCLNDFKNTISLLKGNKKVKTSEYE